MARARFLTVTATQVHPPAHRIGITIGIPNGTHKTQELDVGFLMPYFKHQTRKLFLSSVAMPVRGNLLQLFVIPAYNLAVSNDKLLSSCFDTTGLIPLNPFVFNNKDFAGLESQVSVITTMAEASGITDQLKLQQLQAALPVIGLTQKIRATADSNAQPAAAAAAVLQHCCKSMKTRC